MTIQNSTIIPKIDIKSTFFYHFQKRVYKFLLKPNTASPVSAGTGTKKVLNALSVTMLMELATIWYDFATAKIHT